jgi:chemosensory pili system protein ChpA (sensor histidine kinase/response regulator)
VYTDNDQTEMEIKGLVDPVEEGQEESLRWLLDMEMTESRDSLFDLSQEEYQDEGLSAYEAEVASRPLVRGNAASDDLTTYVAEEIVISSDSSDCSDIYSASDDAAVYADSEGEVAEGSMAIDYSRRTQAGAEEAAPEIDGSDILELSENDDIGEKFVSIKRVKRTEPVEPVEPTESAESEVESPLSLSEAPVPSVIAIPGSHSVANEDPEELPEALSAEESQGFVPAGTALQYVTDNQPPSDDEAFDAYLLEGEQLQADAADPDELVVENTDGIVSVDPSQDTFIDYHEDFLSMEGVDRGAISAVAGVITRALEEVSAAAREYLLERGQAAEALEVDVMLGTDAESTRRCYAEGFEPVTAICRELPPSLQSLANDELETIYLRLFNGQTNESWNDLFSAEADTVDEFEQESWGDPEDMGSVFDELLGQETGEIQALLPVDGEPNGNDVEPGFGEDFLAADFDVDFSDDPSGSALDIEDVFSDVAFQVHGADEICGVDVDEFGLEPAVDPQPVTNPQPVAEQEPAGVETESSLSEPAVEENPSSGSWCVPEGISFNYTSQSNTEIFADFLDAFVEEGSAEVEKLEDAFGEWEKDPTEEAALLPVARTLHTLKGIAKGVGLQRYGTLVHNFETLLEARPRPEAGGEADYFRMVNAWLDAVVRGLEFVQEKRSDVASEFPLQAESARAELPVLQENASESPAAVVAESEQQEQAIELVQEPVTPPAAVQRKKQRDQKLADEGAKALAAQQSVRITAEKLDHLLNLTSQAQQLGVRSAQSTNKGKRATAELQGRLASVRTQIGAIADRALTNVNARGGRTTPDLDALEMDQYSELQEAANILREGVEDLADLVELASRQNAMVDALLKQQASVITSITSSIQAARVVPVSRLMPGLRRIVRTVSTDLNKSVSFKVLNEVGALDRDHYARCQIILEHMVRNALDHGIESAEERLALGKPTTGRITIDVCKSGGDYIIRLADDGRGIDPDAIRESAYRKGLDIDADKLSDDEAMRLIFHKGFSTANSLSEISGRGVGMEIVMSELQQLGGDIQIKSTVGLGTSFEIRIPANVTVNGALFVTAGEDSYAIPLNGLIAVEQVPVADFYRAVEAGSTLSLFDIECDPAYLGTLCQGESLPDASTWGITVPVIIAGSEERYMAIAIDNVEEALELVVRSLGPQFSGVPGVAGAATTADGEAIVALDLNLLVRSVDDNGLSRIAVSHPQESSLLALVVDDSRTQRMVATSQLDTVGVETVTAENGMVAIDLLNGTHRLPDIVLLDVEMPVQDGIETLKEIRKSRRFGHLPVIMVTSRTGAKHRAMAREAGCNGYMGKPFNFPALVEQISELTGHELSLS